LGSIASRFHDFLKSDECSNGRIGKASVRIGFDTPDDGFGKVLSIKGLIHEYCSAHFSESILMKLSKTRHESLTASRLAQ
jgi:hypothetical protein